MEAKDYSTLTTIGGYAVLALAGGLWWYTGPRKNRVQAAKQVARHMEREAAGDSKKTDKTAKPKPKPKPRASSTSEPTTSPTADYDRAAEEAAEKKAAQEFARQSESTRTGTTLSAKKKDEKRQKSVKQSKAQENIPDKTSAPSSTTGDADDDLSPQASPAVEATDSHGVADMLEPTPSGPSVLRLTDTDSVKPKQRQSKPFEPAETKKQRQNRKKVEAARAAREEDEQERKVKMEQQRRTARIAEGRAAKDGSAFTATQNAWNEKPTNGSAPLQLLDTIEKKKEEPQPAKAAPPKPAAPAQAATSDYVNLPSEEEQLKIIAQEDSWNEVKTKKKGKKKEFSDDTPNAPTPSASNQPAITPKSTNVAKKPVLTSSSSSFAALTPEQTEGDDSEAEQEWDV